LIKNHRKQDAQVYFIAELISNEFPMMFFILSSHKK